MSEGVLLTPEPQWECGKEIVGIRGKAVTKCKSVMHRMDDVIDVGPDGYEWRVWLCAQCQRVAYNVDEDPLWPRREPDPAPSPKVVSPSGADVEHVDRGGGVGYAHLLSTFGFGGASQYGE